jgi:hypothetical protein
VSIGGKRIGFIVATAVLSVASSSPAFAEISCQDLKYGNPSYHEKMDELARRAKLPENTWNRYHESLVRDLCAGNIKDADKLVDAGMVKAQQAQAIAKLLGKAYKPKPRSEALKSYASAKQRFLEMGACSACADNIAQYYSKEPSSPCGKLAKQALDGDQEAMKQLIAFPDYCKWRY